MITAYHRPISIEEAITLLSQPNTLPLGGGTLLSRKKDAPFQVVDLQSLGLDKLGILGENLEIGAMVSLQNLMKYSHTPQAVKKAISIEAPINLRNMGSIAGTLVSCDGRSPFGSIMLAMDAYLEIFKSKTEVEEVPFGELLPFRTERLKSKIITCIKIHRNVKSSFQVIARTPMDKPIICVSLVQWPSGRIRLVVGGWGKMPVLAIDGKTSTDLVSESLSLETAASNTTYDAMDEWASVEYRREMAKILTKRCIQTLI